MTIFTDKGLKHNCTVITVVRRHTGVDNYGHCCASGPNTIEEEKVEKYKHLALEIRRIHRATQVTVMPFVSDALGTISANAKAWYGRLSLPDIFWKHTVVGHPCNWPYLAESVKYVYKLRDVC